MGDPGSRLLVLTYHSISASDGPTSTPLDIFAMQMRVLAETGYRSLTVDEFLAWRGGARFDGPRVLITFDDGFEDFASGAAPIMRKHGFTGLNFVPTGRIGGDEAWVGANTPARPLMSWSQVKALSDLGMEFGGHSVTHADLTRLKPSGLSEEISACAAELASRLGKPVKSFAAPYGHMNDAVRKALSNVYEVAFGTRLGRASRDDDPYDVPRIEMFYFREEGPWRGLLEGRSGYLMARQGLRAVRSVALGAGERLGVYGG
jgi:peptidoglycan/xylan/chitin deacetylase (PgdA/CDA1 family)